MKKLVGLSLSFVIACSVIAICVFASAPPGSSQWSGSVDFWETKVGSNITKSNTNTTAFESFTGSPYSLNLFLTMKKTDGAIATAKTKFALGNEKNLPTGAVKDNVLNLYAAREYVLDSKVAVNGSWLP